MFTMKSKVPKAVDLIPDVFEVEDQGIIGSCTANAGCSALELIYKRAKDPKDFSRLYLYYWERKARGMSGDVGADPREITNQLALRGVCLEDTWPYDVTKFDIPPPKEAEDEAPKYKIKDYETIQLAIADLDTIVHRIKVSIANGIPVLQTSMITKSFFSLKGPWQTQSFEIQTSEANQVMGSHETIIIGYDDKYQMFLCQNSWGPNWADGGFFGVPYAYLGTAWIQSLWFLLDVGNVKNIPVTVDDVPVPPPVVIEPVVVQPEPVIEIKKDLPQEEGPMKKKDYTIQIAVVIVVALLLVFLI